MPPRFVRPRRHRRPVARTLLLLIGLLMGLLSLGAAGSVAATASPADGEEFNFRATLRNGTGGAGIEGVLVTVTAPDGSVHEGTSDADGVLVITVPKIAGDFTIVLDESTLPEGVALREGQSAEQTKTIGESVLSQISIKYEIGADTRSVASKSDQVPQLIWNGFLFGIVMSLAALGLSMVFGTTGLVNFAHGELVTFGALVVFFLDQAGVNFILAAVIAVAAAAVFGWLQEAALWGPLRRRGTGLIAMMIVTIGLMFFLRNFFQYLTQGRTETYSTYLTQQGVNVLGADIAPRDAVMAIVSIAVVLAVILALNLTRLGRATRAVADNPALAAATGINVDRVIQLVWIIGTALAALSGVFLGFALGVTFQIGQLVLLLLFAAVTVGGLGSAWGALIGALIIGLLIELSTLVIPPELKNAGAMLLLALILLFRPQGLLGRKERVG